MNYKDILIQLASMTIPYVYDDTISFLELDRKLYKIVHELIVAMQGLNSDYEQFRSDMTNSFNEFTTTINNNFGDFKTDVNNQINTFEENINTNFNSFKTEIENNFNNFKTEIENNFNTLEGEFNTLKDYVDNYFANLNLDEEVQTVIQKMYSDGTLANIINETIFNELNTKIDNLQEQVNNIELITTITNELTYQPVGTAVRYYDSSLKNPSNNELFIVTFPDTDSPSTDVELYYEAWRSSGAGWKITNISGVKDVRGQTLLVQARRGDAITFEVISTQPTKELIRNKISDLLITNCEEVGFNQSGTYYYVYSPSFGIPVDKQLFTIQMPNLPGSNYNVLFYNESQSSSYEGWLLNNAKALDVSNELLLVQASVVDSTRTFNIVGILPSKELIINKISDLLITNCGYGILQSYAGISYVYSTDFGVPLDKQLFIIQMPKISLENSNVAFYNKSQSSSYTGWALLDSKGNNVTAKYVSNQNILIQANVSDGSTSFIMVGVLPVLYDFELQSGSDGSITSTAGTVSQSLLKAKIVGNKQVLFMGSFILSNASGNKTISIEPPYDIGAGAYKDGDILYVQEISTSDSMSYNLRNFTYSSSTYSFNASINNDGEFLYLIMPQFIGIGR